MHTDENGHIPRWIPKLLICVHLCVSVVSKPLSPSAFIGGFNSSIRSGQNAATRLDLTSSVFLKLVPKRVSSELLGSPRKRPRSSQANSVFSFKVRARLRFRPTV